MTPEQFIRKWKASTLTERSASQSHFLDLCRLLGEPAPTDADPAGQDYAFERGVTKTSGGEGWADVWKRGCFAWEYKGRRRDLKAAYAQLQQYAVALDNPPLLIVCDMESFEIHTNWTNTVHEVYRIGLEDLRQAVYRDQLKAAFADPERLKPGRTRQALTEEAASAFAGLAQRLRGRGHAPQQVAHFVNRLVFCMFAEDVGLLPGRMFQRMLEQGLRRPDRLQAMARQLFQAMRGGGLVGFEEVAWFNGGLFDDDEALPLQQEDVAHALAAARLDWAEIDPSIFGTLFERGLDPGKRSQLGAHYTDRDKIMLIIGPVIVEPLTRAWEETRRTIEARLARAEAARSPAARSKALNEAQALHAGFLERLRRFRVLDPACGSGNFLYLALLALKDLEHKVALDGEVLGFERPFPAVGPEAVRGIEINAYAAELARLSVWIGEIQWMRRNGFRIPDNPILKPLDNIACRDALLDADGGEAAWPEADVIIGNPPFLGGKLLRSLLGDAYVDRLFATFAGRVPAEADLVCYWLAKAWEQIRSGLSQQAGLVATNSIRGGANRRVLDVIVRDGTVFDAWEDEPWLVEGAAVRVSLVCFAAEAAGATIRLDGRPVERINADLGASGTDLTRARRLAANAGISFMGDTKGGAFDVPGDLARTWLQLPLNPNGRPNSDVLRPWMNGMDVTRRPADKWIVDFGWEMSEEEASLYEAPFGYAYSNVRADRVARQKRGYARKWWRHERPRPDMWEKIRPLQKYIATPTVAKHRLFIWLKDSICPDHQLIVITSDSTVIFGILHSRFHELWALGLGTWLGVGNDPRYTPSTTFETFPFPAGLGPGMPAAACAAHPHAGQIAAAARRLDELRGGWLNPPDLVRREPEVVAGFPDRLVPVDAKAAVLLKQRTLTRLYNERPAWLQNAHRALDEAVAAAYGWPADLADDEVLKRLLALNLEQAAADQMPL